MAPAALDHIIHVDRRRVAEDHDLLERVAVERAAAAHARTRRSRAGAARDGAARPGAAAPAARAHVDPVGSLDGRSDGRDRGRGLSVQDGIRRVRQVVIGQREHHPSKVRLSRLLERRLEPCLTGAQPRRVRAQTPWPGRRAQVRRPSLQVVSLAHKAQPAPLRRGRHLHRLDGPEVLPKRSQEIGLARHLLGQRRERLPTQ